MVDGFTQDDIASTFVWQVSSVVTDKGVFDFTPLRYACHPCTYYMVCTLPSKGMSPPYKIHTPL